MKKTSLLRLPLIALMAFGLDNANAGSAVALGPHNQLFTSFGHPREMAKEIALDLARNKYGDNVRILASSDVTGYCAIATARHPNGNWVIGVALGQRSAAEADTLAIDQCIKAGGAHPQVRSVFKG